MKYCRHGRLWTISHSSSLQLIILTPSPKQEVIFFSQRCKVCKYLTKHGSGDFPPTNWRVLTHHHHGDFQLSRIPATSHMFCNAQSFLWFGHFCNTCRDRCHDNRNLFWSWYIAIFWDKTNLDISTDRFDEAFYLSNENSSDFILHMLI